MWLAIALVIATPLAARTPPAKAAPVVAPAPAEAPAPTPPPPPSADPAPAPAIAAEPNAPAPTPHAVDVGVELGVDVPAAQRIPMASARLVGAWRLPTPQLLSAAVGVKSGYSYVAGESAVADPGLGVDQHAFLMAHRIPIRALGRFGLRSDNAPLAERPVEVGVEASGGADVIMLQAQAFGRSTSQVAVAPAGSLGAYFSVQMSDSFGLGLLGEWDAVALNLAASAPGLSGDLSAMRIALRMSFLFG